MSYAPRPTTVFPNSSSSTTSSLRGPSIGANAQSQQSAILAARINSKRQELENLKQLRDLSGALANQIAELETKLGTLRDGTEAVACVLANWDNVLRAINMASRPQPTSTEEQEPQEAELPVTLVRIPAQQKGQNGENGHAST